MRLRAGIVIGFAAGYYLGAKAGRQRYEQINRTIGKIKRSDAYETATEKTKAVVDLGVERAKDLVESKVGGNGTNGMSTEPPRTDPPVRP